MRLLATTVVVLVLTMGVQASVWTTVYRCDDKTRLTPVDPNHPFVFREIMVGTRLIIVVSSDSDNQYWVGSLQYAAEDAAKMSLTGRGYDPVRGAFAGSCLPAAGRAADVTTRDSMGIWCLDLTTDPHPLQGDWFVLDYEAKGSGSCDVGFYDLYVDWNLPADVLSFRHTPSRDFDGNGRVDFKDYALLASRMSLSDPVEEQNALFDLDADGLIDLRDLSSFSDYWLERTGCGVPVEPNEP